MAAAAAQEIVGKAGLCEHLGWGRPRLDRVLERDARFPVVSRGDQSGGWAFRKSEVDAYLNGGVPKGIDLAQLRDTVKKPAPRSKGIDPRAEQTAVQVVDALKGASPERKPNGRAATRPSAYHSGEAGAKQRDLEASASLKEDKLRQLRGETVDKGELRQALAAVMARLGHDLDALPEKIAKTLERDDMAPGIRTLVDQVRTEMVRGLEPLLTETETQSP